MNSSLLFSIATLSYLVAMVLYISYLAFRKSGIGRTATGVTVFGFLVQTAALLLRWYESYQMDIGRVPLSNLYESLVFFTWSTVLIYLVVEFKYKTKAFGAFVMPVAFLALAFINVAGISSDITPLVPALKSNWLFYHVLVSFLGYAAFGVAFAISMVYLLMDIDEKGAASNLLYAMAAIVILAVIGYFMASLGERMKTAFWMGLGVLTLIWFIYLIVKGARNKSQVYLFWSFCVTLAVGLLVAMGIDFVYLVTFQHLAAGESFKKHMFEATFLNSNTAVAVVSWLAVLAIFYLVWSKGLGLRNLLKQYIPAQDQLDDVTYRMIAIGWP
ncbi:MAG: cytochrome c biogenesis protein, partial [Betaproteobacteria bacterium]